jgi:hypothetical protein
MRGLKGVVDRTLILNRITHRKTVAWFSDKDIAEGNPTPWLCPLNELQLEDDT